MPEIQSVVTLAWGDAADLQAVTTLAWGDAADLQSIGSPYTPPAPGGGTPVTPGGLTPLRDIISATTNVDSSALQVIDLRDDIMLDVTSVSLDLPDGSDLWTFRGEGPASLVAALNAGEQPATVEVSIGPDKWRFVIEEVDQPRTFSAQGVTIRGRSLASAAGEPYQVVQTWIADAPTSAAQIAALANTFTGVEVDWDLADWPIPAGAWSATADPLTVVRQMAAAVGAVVEAHRTELRLSVRSRYPSAPNTWAIQRPDVQIDEGAFTATRTTRADQPPYNGVLVAGQQSGGLLQARLAGTSGSLQAPMVTDPLLTDPAAQVERATSLLHGYGGRNRETRTLPLFGGVIQRGALVRCVEEAATWTGMVRAVSVSATLQQARQTITMERPTSFPVGASEPEPIACVPDPHSASVIAFLQFEGTDGTQTILDSSPSNRTVTCSGAAAVSNSVSKNGIGAIHLSSTGFGAYFLTLPNSGDFNISPIDFTVEMWALELSGSLSSLMSRRPGGLPDGWALTTSGLRAKINGVWSDTQMSWAGPTRNVWHHYAWVRGGSQMLVFVDGKLVASKTGVVTIDDKSQNVYIGQSDNASENKFLGYMDDIRWTRGVARYLANFAVPDRTFCNHA